MQGKTMDHRILVVMKIIDQVILIQNFGKKKMMVMDIVKQMMIRFIHLLIRMLENVDTVFAGKFTVIVQIWMIMQGIHQMLEIKHEKCVVSGFSRIEVN